MTVAISVLLADDNQLVLDSVEAWLEDDGFAVYTATSAEEALQVLTTQPIDVVLVDLKLPDMSGETFITKALRIRPLSRFVIHTGSRSYGLSSELQQLGMQDDDIIYKPIQSLKELTELIQIKVAEGPHQCRTK
ncbi:MAG TPA: response regulator [Desulfuromonadaceae bacterium]|jgi:CheY-like chemotaxis protein